MGHQVTNSTWHGHPFGTISTLWSYIQMNSNLTETYHISLWALNRLNPLFVKVTAAVSEYSVLVIFLFTIIVSTEVGTQ